MEQGLSQAPQRQWSRAGCNYGLVVEVLQGCEQVLRQAGLHTSGDQLQQLLSHFLRSRRNPLLEGKEPPPRPQQPPALPRPANRRQRRRLPRLPSS